VDLDVEAVGEAAAGEAGELCGLWVETVEDVGVDGIEAAVDAAVVGVEGDGIEADPPVAPARVGAQVAVVPSADDVLPPAGEAVVAEDVGLDRQVVVHGRSLKAAGYGKSFVAIVGAETGEVERAGAGVSGW
jgi:hypothetical protein